MTLTHIRSSSWQQQRSSLHLCLAQCFQSQCWSDWSWWNIARLCRPSLCLVLPPSGPCPRRLIYMVSPPSLLADTTSCPASRCWCPHRSPHSLQYCTRYKLASGPPAQTHRPVKLVPQPHTQCSGPVFWQPDPNAAGGPLWVSWRDCWFPGEEDRKKYIRKTREAIKESNLK